jgi:peptidoglycan-associated lipoprotein
MSKKSFAIIILILCLGLIIAGCPKKTVVKEEPSSRMAEESAAAERERAAARLETERKEREAREREQARIKEEEMKAAQKKLEEGLVPKKYPGIEGEVLVSSQLKDIHFDFDRYDIRPGDTEILKQNEAFLRKYPNMKIQIEGHCDERGTVEYNLALGERRANSAKRYLTSLGIPGNRISTISYGKERPEDPGHNEEAWAKNRRAHFVILSK